ncbi:hypothetical protein [Cellulosilyticum ruminicola]|uniref:hypothetical protein n=1 Tax=Cellulosilyticum ruminicola TaxID=425254 RepID=UPI00155DA40B|nr:hypothetical protein [Cellulosilyticum ruminicola]
MAKVLMRQVAFEALPKFKLTYQGEDLIANKDFIMVVQEGQIVLTFKRALNGKLGLQIIQLTVKSEMNLDLKPLYLYPILLK